ncbi:MAG: hypothetical protein EXS25_01755 [Pedosphaera sp.]|nr:hypothetical protein [Pedosphaera sp.]
MSPFSIFARFFVVAILVSGCEPKSEVVAPKDSSAEAKSLAEATSKAAMEQPADALALVESLNRRNDVSTADRAVALKAQQDALKKLAEDAASGNAQAQSAIDRYRASK